MSKKDIIYIDIEDDITAIIDKVKVSKAEIVALVPPKRSTVLQSTVNMKLLKRAGDKDSKKIVLISSEASLMPLAGGVGMFMADSLQSRPKVPEVEKAEIDDSTIEDDEIIDDATAAAAGASVGAAAVAATKQKDDGPAKPVAAKKPKEKSEKLKSLKSGSKIPNFSKFRLRMILAVAGIVLLIVLWFLGFRVFPSASITIQAQTSRVPIDTSFVADVNAQTDLDEGIIEANQQTLTKTVTEEFNATGEKDVGEKATGSMTVQNCDSSSTLTIPSGTNFTDPSSGHVFTSNSSVDVPGGSFSGGGCSTPGEGTVTVTASNSGDDKNLSPRSYRVSGYGGTVTGFGDQMSGGTTKKVKVISQADVDEATKRLNERGSDTEREELLRQFSDSSYAVTESFAVNTGQVSVTPAVGTESGKGVLTAQATYTMLGVQRDNLDQYLEKVAKEQLGDSEQSVLETGINEANISILTVTSQTNMTIAIKTNSYAGPEIDEDTLKEEIKNKRYSEAKSIIEGKDGVKEAEIDLSPFWIANVPGRTGKINITIEVSESTLQ